MSLFLLVLSGNSQEEWQPLPEEIKIVDSVVLSKFIDCDCFDSLELYKLRHIFEFDYKDDTIKKSHFLDKTVLLNIRKSYFLSDVSRSLNEMNDSTIPKGYLNTYVSYIADSKDQLVGCWYPDEAKGICLNPPFKDYQLFDRELFQILKQGDYKIIFHVFRTAGNNYVAIEDNGEINILTYLNGETFGVRKISVNELVNDYWKQFDVFRLDP